MNLLREGLDLPEVELVAILDADKEGLLRNERSLIQTIGRAARNSLGRVIMYADKMTGSMEKAIEETHRRREKQTNHNRLHNITPTSIIKGVSKMDRPDADDQASKNKKQKTKNYAAEHSEKTVPEVIAILEHDMVNAAENLEFELAASLRDQIMELKDMKS